MSIAMNGLNYREHLEEALTNDNAVVRIMARASFSTWTEDLQRWLNEEVQRGNPADVLSALAQVQVMIHSSFASQIVLPPGIPSCLELYRKMLDGLYVEHARASRAAAEEARR